MKKLITMILTLGSLSAFAWHDVNSTNLGQVKCTCSCPNGPHVIGGSGPCNPAGAAADGTGANMVDVSRVAALLKAGNRHANEFVQANPKLANKLGVSKVSNRVGN